MQTQDIPRYDFNNRHTDIGFEIIPLKRILAHSRETGFKAHRLKFYEILFITNGEGVVEVDFETIAYKRGTIIPVAPGQVQSFDTNVNFEGFALLFTPDFIVKEDIDYRYLYEYISFNHSIKPVTLNTNIPISNLFREMETEQKKEQALDMAEYQRNLLKNFLILLEREKRTKADIVCNVSLDLYLKFRKILEENVSYKVRVVDICEKLNVSAKQMNSAVKLFSNTTAKEYIEDRVILEIKRLLVYSMLSIKEIAYSIGFEDPTNFTKYFKARVNMLPTDYQKQHR